MHAPDEQIWTDTCTPLLVPLGCNTLTTPRPGGRLRSWKGYGWKGPWDTKKMRRKKKLRKKCFASWKWADTEPHHWALCGEHTLTQLHIGYPSANGSYSALQNHSVRHCWLTSLCLITGYYCAELLQHWGVLSNCTMEYGFHETVRRLTVLIELGNVAWLSLTLSYGSLACRWVWMLAPFCLWSFSHACQPDRAQRAQARRDWIASDYFSSVSSLDLDGLWTITAMNNPHGGDCVLRMRQERMMKKQVMIEYHIVWVLLIKKKTVSLQI